jgi:hypothetical protein
LQGISLDTVEIEADEIKVQAQLLMALAQDFFVFLDPTSLKIVYP